MNKIILTIIGIFILIGSLNLVNPYTAPPYTNVTLTFEQSYTAPSYTNVTLFFGEEEVPSEDTTPPTITWESPTPTDNDTIDYDSVYLNTTITDSSNTSAWFDWNKSLVGYLAMDFYNSSGIYDNSTYNNFGIFYNTDESNITIGKFGNSFNFSGNDYKSYMDLGNDGSLIISDAITLDLLVKPAPNQEFCYNGTWGNNAIVGSVNSAEGTTTWSWQLRYGSSADCSLGLQLNTVAGGKWVTLGYNLSTEDWSHIVTTFNGTDVKIYVNSILINTTTFASTTINTNPNNKILLGNGGWGESNTYYKGEIDEFKIFNRALSVEEIKASYDNSLYRLYHNFTDLDNGVYNYSAYAIDSAGNLNITNERVININVAPTICNPTIDTDWNIVDEQVCDATQVSTGTGSINILTGGTLILINSANVSTTKLNLQTTGDQVFICTGCEVRIG